MWLQHKGREIEAQLYTAEAGVNSKQKNLKIYQKGNEKGIKSVQYKKVKHERQ